MTNTSQSALSAPQDPVFLRMPHAELERRWSAIRAHMAESGLDAIVVAGFDDSLSGYLRWFCDFGSPAYMKVVMFFANGSMASVEHGGLGAARNADPKGADSPGIERVFTTAAFKSVAVTFTYEADIVVAELGRRGSGRVGLVRPGGMPHAFVTRLQQGLPKVVWSDETEALDRIKAVKGAAEIDSLRGACALQDEVFAKLLEQVKPGVREVELLSFAEREFRLRGAIDGAMACGSAPQGKPAMLRGWRAVNRVLQRGDCFTVLLEMSNAAGYYSELARHVVIGKATQEHKEVYRVLREAQVATVSQFRPGASCAAIAASHDRFITERGFPPETRLYSHSQGYDLVERPLIRHDETMKLEAGMFLSCHPTVVRPSLFAFLCDNFLIRSEGPAERIHKTAQEIFEV